MTQLELAIEAIESAFSGDLENADHAVIAVYVSHKILITQTHWDLIRDIHDLGPRPITVEELEALGWQAAWLNELIEFTEW